jgi:methionyl-tRNA formyltransferase
MELQIDLLLNGELGKWVHKNYQWGFGRTYCYWKDAGVSWEADCSLFLPQVRYAAISIHWPKKILLHQISRYKHFLNIHPGYLPLGRGMYPVFWSVFLKEKAGATTHQITDVFDDGPILFRSEVKFDEQCTGGQVWDLVFQVEKQQFEDTIELLLSFPDELPYFVDHSPKGPNRKKIDFLNLRDRPPLSQMKVQEVQRLIKALTDTKYPIPKWISDIRDQD